jgi:hypothetical protein
MQLSVVELLIRSLTPLLAQKTSNFYQHSSAVKIISLPLRDDAYVHSTDARSLLKGKKHFSDLCCWLLVLYFASSLLILLDMRMWRDEEQHKHMIHGEHV